MYTYKSFCRKGFHPFGRSLLRLRRRGCIEDESKEGLNVGLVATNLQVNVRVCNSRYELAVVHEPWEVPGKEKTKAQPD